MAELVDALGLGSSEVIRGGSSPLTDIETIGNIRWFQLSGQVVKVSLVRDWHGRYDMLKQTAYVVKPLSSLPV